MFALREEHQSYPGRLHGGIASAILDETIGRAITISYPGTWGVTVELSLRYRKPVPLTSEIRAVGRITRDTRRLFEGSGEILLADGTVAVEARGKYLKAQLDEIVAEGLDERDWFADPRRTPEDVELHRHPVPLAARLCLRRPSVVPEDAGMDWTPPVRRHRRARARPIHGRPVAAEDRAALERFCSHVAAQGDKPASCHVEFVEDEAQDLFTGLIGGYGKVAGTPLAAVFAGAQGADGDVGYLGEAFILEVDQAGPRHVLDRRLLRQGARGAGRRGGNPARRSSAVTPIGHPARASAAGENRAARHTQGLRVLSGREAGSRHPQRRLAAVDGGRGAGGTGGALRRQPPALALQARSAAASS